MKKRLLVTLLTCMALFQGTTHAREKIRIVGASDVLAFVQTVAENFSFHYGHPTPFIEITGTGGGFHLLCRGIGFEHPDIVASPRSMTAAELSKCAQNGVMNITEMIFGLDGLVLVNSTRAQQYNFTPEELYRALAAKIIKNGEMIDNPYDMWNQINPVLPIHRIRVMGPEPGSSTENAFMNLIMDPSCRANENIHIIGPAQRIKFCQTMRSDEIFLQGPKNENTLIDLLVENPVAFGVTRYSRLARNHHLITGNPINGVAPTTQNITRGTYPLTQSLYLYIKTDHVGAVKGLQQFLYEVSSERAIGPDGYLVEDGFIPLDDSRRNYARDLALSLETMKK